MPQENNCNCPECKLARATQALIDFLNRHNGGQPISPPPQMPVFVIFNNAFSNDTASKEELQNALVEALANEEYEVAAELRDKINGMKE